LEYFIGDDPGYGAGAILSISVPSEQVELSSNIPTVSLDIGRYTLSVRAKNADGVWGLQQTEVFDVQNLPGTDLLTPSDSSGLLSLPISFTWLKVEQAKFYHFQLSESSDFTASTIDSTQIVANSLTLDDTQLAFSTTYFWRVRTLDGSRVGPWTDPWSFTTISAIANAPVLVSPSDSAIDVPIPATLTWQLVGGAQSYSVEVSLNPLFEDSQRWDGIIVAELIVGGISDTTTYFWRVTAAAANSEPVTSPIWQFRTELRLPAILDWGDEDGASPLDSTMILRWSAITRATRYDLQISTDSTFSATERDLSGLDGTSTEVAELDGSTRYHWRVRGVNVRGAGPWSDSRAFVTPVFTSIDDESVLPTTTALRSNYPNPFNPSTVIAYQLAVSGLAKITVYDLLGRQVAVLVDGMMTAGSHTVTFDAKNLTSGMYVYRLEAGGKVLTRKMTLVK
jgi:hypothetical protein